jgi:pantetheine-phosphate adenylyltransferase
LDIIKTGSEIFDEVIVLVAKNPKKPGFIPIDTRVKLVEQSVKGLNNVKVDTHNGLTVDYAKLKDAKFLLRGLRTVSDFDSEMQISEINKMLNPKIKTVFLNSSSEYSAISSSAVREILGNNGNITKFVPSPVEKYLSRYPKGQ